MKKIGLHSPKVFLLVLFVLIAAYGTPALAEKKTVRIAYEEWSSEIASTNLVKAVHSYDVPEVIALPIIGGNAEYLAWIDTETDAG